MKSTCPIQRTSIPASHTEIQTLPTKSRAESVGGDANVFYGDDNLSPSLVNLFKTTLQKQLSSDLDGKNVVLTGFVVSVRVPSASVDSAKFEAGANSIPNASAASRILVAPVILGIETISSQKSVTVLIHGRVDNKEFRTFYFKDFRGRVTEDNMKFTITGALDQLVSDIRMGLYAPTPLPGLPDLNTNDTRRVAH